MSRHPAPAPDDVLQAILHQAVDRENHALPLDVFVQLGLGRDPTLGEIRRMIALGEAGRQRELDRLARLDAEAALLEAELAIFDELGLDSLDRDELERLALARLDRARQGC